MKTEEITEHEPSNIVFHLQLENFTYNVWRDYYLLFETSFSCGSTSKFEGRHKHEKLRMIMLIDCGEKAAL